MNRRLLPLLLLLAGLVLAGGLWHRPPRLAASTDSGRTPAAAPGASTPSPAAPEVARAAFLAPRPPGGRGTALPAGLAEALRRWEADVADTADLHRTEARLAALLAGIRPEQTRDVLAALGQDPSPAAAALGERLVRRWAAEAPAEAARWVADWPGPARTDWLTQAALGWADSDPAGALSWAAGLADAPGFREARLAVAHELARSQPVPALELAASLAAGTDRDQFLAHGAAQWAAEDAASAAAWVAQLPPGPLHDELLARTALAQAGHQPAEAAALVRTGLPSGPVQETALVQIAQRWVQTDPPGTLAWLATLPDSPIRLQATEQVFQIWLHQDAGGLEQWLQTAPPGTERDQALGSLARFTSRTNAAGAAVWLAQMTDPALRASIHARLPTP